MESSIKIKRKNRTMQKTKFITTIAALGLLTFGTGSLRAGGGIDDLETVNIQFTVTKHDATITNGVLVKETVAKMKVTTKDILNLIADNYGTNFPSGAQLVMVNWGFFFSVYDGDPNNGGTDLLNVGSDLIGADYKNDIRKTTRNSRTGSETYDNTYVTYLSFDDGDYNDDGNYFDFYGLSQWEASYNGTNGKFTESIKAQGPVEGSISGDDFVGSGTMTCKGKGMSKE
jgi:hypothetical protein